MQLTVWTYEGPPHVGAMRVVTAMRGVHYVLHAPQGDTYADLLFTMIERRKTRPPVTYTTFQARDLGKDTAEIFKRSAREAYDRFQPDLVLVGASCTAELIQDDPSGIGQTIGIKIGQLHIPHPGQGVADAQSAEVAVLKRQARHQISSLAQHIVSEDGAGCGETARGN